MPRGLVAAAKPWLGVKRDDSASLPSALVRNVARKKPGNLFTEKDKTQLKSVAGILS